MSVQSFKRERPTIGILTGWSSLEGTTPDHYRMSVIRGIQSAARSRGCHLLLGLGIRRITEVRRLHPPGQWFPPKLILSRSVPGTPTA
jgi:hypothetical protein